MKAASGSSSPSLERRILSCRACPRLVAYHDGIAAEHPDWHCRPVVGWGEPDSPVVLIGLAPSRTGGNRTGRIFTGDKTGDFLFEALHQAGFCSQPTSRSKGDGQRLKGIYLTPALKCAPPQDKPTPEELRRCFPFFEEELAALRKARVVIALGKIAHEAYLRLRGKRLSEFPFAHGRIHDLGDEPALLDTYHCSPRNTHTGLLTPPMLRAVLRKARRLAELT